MHTGLGDALGGRFLRLGHEDFLQAGGGFELRVDAIVELVPHTGDGEQHGGLDFDALVGNAGQVGDEVDVHAATNHPVQVKGRSEGVRPRQEGGVLVTDVNRERRLNTEDVGQRVPVGQHHALGVPGGPGGVDERVEGERVVSHLKGFGLAPFGNKGRPAVNGHALRGQFVGLVFTQEQHAASGPSTGIGGHVGHQLVEHGGVGHR